MIKTYRDAQHWDHWLSQHLGKSVLTAEHDFLSYLYTKRYGKHALIIGVPRQQTLFESLDLARHVLLSPVIRKNTEETIVESAFDELPIASGSIDLVILPHTLELVDNPRQLLNEACRIVKPEGEIIIFGFHPLSLWGLKRRWMSQKKMPWSLHFISPAKTKHWLTLADFQLIRQDALLFRPPLQQHRLFDRLKWLEWLGRKLRVPCGGVYVINAKAKVIPLTPIKLRWKQQISTLKVTLPGPTMRDMR